jgi:hypothetical protein
MPLPTMPPPTTLFIAVGNYLHGDEAVAHRVLSLLAPREGVGMYDALHWSSDLAQKIAEAKEVVFVDADQQLGEPLMSPLDGRSAAGQIVAQARQNFQFSGKAYLCLVPGLEFGRRETGLTAYAESRARQAAAMLQKFLGPEPTGA